jgi:hypothetical protein
MSHSPEQQPSTSSTSGGDGQTPNQKGRDPPLTEEWFKGFFKTVGGISTLGAGFTFGAIFTDLELKNPPPNFNPESVRERLEICWLLFVIALALSGGFASYMVLVEGTILDVPGGLISLSLLSLLLQLLLVGAFIAASLALMPYGKVGLGALILTGIGGALLLLIWFIKAVSLPNTSFSNYSELNHIIVPEHWAQ